MDEKPVANTAARNVAYQFSLGSLMLIVIWLATVLALIRLVPLLGGLYFISSLPAVARTWRFTVGRKIAGHQLGNWAVVRAFLKSQEIVALLTATAIAVAVGALAAGCMWSLVIATRCSRIVAGILARLAHLLGRLVCRTAPAASWLADVALRASRREPLCLTLPCGVILLACAVVSGAATAALTGIISVIAGIRILADGFASTRGIAQGAGRRLWLNTAVLVQAEGNLLRVYRMTT